MGDAWVFLRPYRAWKFYVETGDPVPADKVQYLNDTFPKSGLIAKAGSDEAKAAVAKRKKSDKMERGTKDGANKAEKGAKDED